MALFKKKTTETVAVPATEAEKLAKLWSTQFGQELKTEPLSKLNFITEGYYLYFYEGSSLAAICNLPLPLDDLKKLSESLTAILAEQGRKLCTIVRPASELADALALLDYAAGLSYHKLTVNESSGLLCFQTGLLEGHKATKAVLPQPLNFLPSLLFWPLRLKHNAKSYTLVLEDWRFAAGAEIKREDSLVVKVTIKEKAMSCYYHLLIVAGEQKDKLKTGYIEAVLAQQRAFYKLLLPEAFVSFEAVSTMPATQGLQARGHFYHNYGHKMPALLAMPADCFKSLLSLALPKDNQSLLNYGTKDGPAMVTHLNHQLQAKFYPYANRFYLYAHLSSLSEDFNPFTADKTLSLIELLMLLNEQDYKLIVQNFVIPKLGNKLGELLSYKKVVRSADGSQKIVTVTITDVDNGRLIAGLPAMLQEGIPKQVAADEEQWHRQNVAALTQLAEMVEKRQLEVGPTTHTLIENEIIHHLHEKERKAYSEMWDNNFIPRWKLAEQKDKIRIIDKLDNRQWAEILAVKPANFEVVSRYISSGRRKFLKEEMDYILQRGLNYAEANGALRALF